MTDDELIDIYRQAKTIAVVGASSNPEKPAHQIPAYLQSVGYRIIPVNPTADRLFGEEALDSLDQVTEHVDIVDVFRPADQTPPIARQAAEIGADVLWLQEGISSEEAASIASEAGMTVVMDLCLGATHQRLADRI